MHKGRSRISDLLFGCAATRTRRTICGPNKIRKFAYVPNCQSAKERPETERHCAREQRLTNTLCLIPVRASAAVPRGPASQAGGGQAPRGAVVDEVYVCVWVCVVFTS